MTEKILIYTDGACRGNPGPGGWGVLIYRGQDKQTLYGGEPDTTNNRMELQAAIAALQHLPSSSVVKLVTDSNYVKNGVTQWVNQWKRNGWRTSQKKAVKNQDLWQKLDELASLHQVEWVWVKGHSGDSGNEMADALANRAIDEL